MAAPAQFFQPPEPQPPLAWGLGKVLLHRETAAFLVGFCTNDVGEVHRGHQPVFRAGEAGIVVLPGLELHAHIDRAIPSPIAIVLFSNFLALFSFPFCTLAVFLWKIGKSKRGRSAWVSSSSLLRLREPSVAMGRARKQTLRLYESTTLR